MYVWMLAAILLCGLNTECFGQCCCCQKNHANNTSKEVEKIELIRTSQSWDGVELPDYLQGKPELVAMK